MPASNSAHNIRHTTTVPHSPQENSLAKRVNRTILDNAGAALFSNSIPPQYWEQAIRDVTDKYNHTIHHATNQIPEGSWTGKTIYIQTLHLLIQLGYVYIPSQKSKLQPRASLNRYLCRDDMNHYLPLNLNHKNITRCRPSDFTA